MSQAPEPIDDICWQLFDGPCGVWKTKEELMSCDRRMRTCDVFITRFREAIVVLRKAEAKQPEVQPTQPAKPDKPEAKAEEKNGAKAAPAGKTSSDPPLTPPWKPTTVAGGIRFAFESATAKKVEVAGTFCEWKPLAMQPQAGRAGLWTIVVSIPKGEHSYKFVVDGKWIKPPEAPRYVSDGQDSENGIITI